MRGISCGSRCLVIALAIAGLHGCGEVPSDGPSLDETRWSYTGSVEDSDAVIGVTVRGDRLSAYICGGDRSYASMTRWFYRKEIEPTWIGGTFAMAKDDWWIHGELEPEGASGTLRTGDGQVKSWTALPRAAGTIAGTYSAGRDTCRIGAVVLQPEAGGPSTVQGVWCDGPDRLAQVTPIRPVVLTAGGLEVEIAPDGVAERVFLEPVLAGDPD